MDRRIQKTKKIISDTFMELLNEKTFSEITIKKICDKALIARNTFYVHFQDKYELLDYHIRSVSEGLYTKYLEEIDINKSQEDIPEYLAKFAIKVLNYTINNKNVFIRLYQNKGIESTIVYSSISKIIYKIFNSIFSSITDINEKKKQYIISFLIGGFIGLINDLIYEEDFDPNKLYDDLYNFFDINIASYLKNGIK